jgi:hypothetical protein
MARKAKEVTASPKTRTSAATTVRREARRDAQPANNGDSNRLLREAAWSRMFGRVESKNPFTR